MAERPNIKDFLTEETKITNELYDFISALNNYINELEKKLSNNQPIQLTNKKNYVALFRIIYAIGVEEYEVETKTKLCDEQTTVGEIFNWFKSKVGNKVKFRCDIVEAE